MRYGRLRFVKMGQVDGEVRDSFLFPQQHEGLHVVRERRGITGVQPRYLWRFAALVETIQNSFRAMNVSV